MNSVSCLRTRGNGILELLLFLPLALFFLFIVIDGGLAMVERAALHDALRSGINSHIFTSKKHSPLVIDEWGVVEIDHRALRALTDDVLAEIAANVERVKRDYRGEGIIAAAEVSAIALHIDPVNGSMLNYETLTTSRYSRGRINPPPWPDDYLEPALANATLPTGESAYARRLGAAYRPERGAAAEPRFARVSLLLYAEVRTIADGTNRNFVRSALGQNNTVQIRHLEALRRSY